MSARAQLLVDRPWLTLLVASGAVLLVLYSVFVSQELFVVIWAAFVAFFAYLAIRFVRAHERIARAAERIAEDPD